MNKFCPHNREKKMCNNNNPKRSRMGDIDDDVVEVYNTSTEKKLFSIRFQL